MRKWELHIGVAISPNIEIGNFKKQNGFAKGTKFSPENKKLGKNLSGEGFISMK